MIRSVLSLTSDCDWVTFGAVQISENLKQKWNCVTITGGRFSAMCGPVRLRSSELNFQRNSVFNLSQLFASQHYCKHCGTDQEKKEDDSGETQDGEERPRRRTPTQ